MDLLDKELLHFFTCAQKNQLRYMIIGGYAVNYYGFIRNTGDLDIWLAPTNENKLAFIKTLLCLNFSEIMPALFINVIPYDFLINMKLKSRRDKDLWDVARLNELKLKNKKK